MGLGLWIECRIWAMLMSLQIKFRFRIQCKWRRGTKNLAKYNISARCKFFYSKKSNFFWKMVKLETKKVLGEKEDNVSSKSDTESSRPKSVFHIASLEGRWSPPSFSFFLISVHFIGKGTDFRIHESIGNMNLLVLCFKQCASLSIPMYFKFFCKIWFKKFKWYTKRCHGESVRSSRKFSKELHCRNDYRWN